MKKLSIILFFAVIFSGCGAILDASDADSVTLTGNLQKMGVTTYQYGTHIITYGGKPYALRSSALNLDTYIDKQVTLRGAKVSGYPVESGPELIEVSEVVVK